MTTAIDPQRGDILRRTNGRTNYRAVHLTAALRDVITTAEEAITSEDETVDLGDLAVKVIWARRVLREFGRNL